jgi:hypothetical protein
MAMIAEAVQRPAGATAGGVARTWSARPSYIRQLVWGFTLALTQCDKLCKCLQVLALLNPPAAASFLPPVVSSVEAKSAPPAAAMVAASMLCSFSRGSVRVLPFLWLARARPAPSERGKAEVLESGWDGML